MNVWDQMTADTFASQAMQEAREHRTLADLLVARGQTFAAGIVAASGYDSIQVDNWNGGQYESALSVPTVLFDRVDDETRSAIETAARDIVGGDRFRGLSVQIKLIEPEPD